MSLNNRDRRRQGQVAAGVPQPVPVAPATAEKPLRTSGTTKDKGTEVRVSRGSANINRIEDLAREDKMQRKLAPKHIRRSAAAAPVENTTSNATTTSGTSGRPNSPNKKDDSQKLLRVPREVTVHLPTRQMTHKMHTDPLFTSLARTTAKGPTRYLTDYYSDAVVGEEIPLGVAWTHRGLEAQKQAVTLTELCPLLAKKLQVPRRFLWLAEEVFTTTTADAAATGTGRAAVETQTDKNSAAPVITFRFLQAWQFQQKVTGTTTNGRQSLAERKSKNAGPGVSKVGGESAKTVLRTSDPVAVYETGAWELVAFPPPTPLESHLQPRGQDTWTDCFERVQKEWLRSHITTTTLATSAGANVAGAQNEPAPVAELYEEEFLYTLNKFVHGLGVIQLAELKDANKMSLCEWIWSRCTCSLLQKILQLSTTEHWDEHFWNGSFVYLTSAHNCSWAERTELLSLLLQRWHTRGVNEQAALDLGWLSHYPSARCPLTAPPLCHALRQEPRVIWPFLQTAASAGNITKVSNSTAKSRRAAGAPRASSPSGADGSSTTIPNRIHQEHGAFYMPRDRKKEQLAWLEFLRVLIFNTATAEQRVDLTLPEQSTGLPPLCFAARRNQAEVVRMMLQRAQEIGMLKKVVNLAVSYPTSLGGLLFRKNQVAEQNNCEVVAFTYSTDLVDKTGANYNSPSTSMDKDHDAALVPDVGTSSSSQELDWQMKLSVIHTGKKIEQEMLRLTPSSFDVHKVADSIMSVASNDTWAGTLDSYITPEPRSSAAGGQAESKSKRNRSKSPVAVTKTVSKEPISAGAAAGKEQPLPEHSSPQARLAQASNQEENKVGATKSKENNTSPRPRPVIPNFSPPNTPRKTQMVSLEMQSLLEQNARNGADSKSKLLSQNTHNGYTPLMLAVQFGARETFDLLLDEAGFALDLSHTAHDGHTVFSLACNDNSREVWPEYGLPDLKEYNPVATSCTNIVVSAFSLKDANEQPMGLVPFPSMLQEISLSGKVPPSGLSAIAVQAWECGRLDTKFRTVLEACFRKQLRLKEVRPIFLQSLVQRTKSKISAAALADLLERACDGGVDSECVRTLLADTALAFSGLQLPAPSTGESGRPQHTASKKKMNNLISPQDLQSRDNQTIFDDEEAPDDGTNDIYERDSWVLVDEQDAAAPVLALKKTASGNYKAGGTTAATAEDYDYIVDTSNSMTDSSRLSIVSHAKAHAVQVLVKMNLLAQDIEKRQNELFLAKKDKLFAKRNSAMIYNNSTQVVTTDEQDQDQLFLKQQLPPQEHRVLVKRVKADIESQEEVVKLLEAYMNQVPKPAAPAVNPRGGPQGEKNMVSATSSDGSNETANSQPNQKDRGCAPGRGGGCAGGRPGKVKK
ncbi:unnamed protein product [Amoebophrya sp. A120]|nr:unnamed protein product [Amoebophrya sp. A120]|eukprot:GSA120T00020081001.1